MGTVWMAEQTEPVKRKVAIKLIRAERGQSKAILSRFEAERQAIAMMDHPHIAKLLDAGTTDDGSPFFAMELVSGTPLHEFCDRHKLTIPDRLMLFVQICGAVQHAHQKGIIHRDLKPSNILVESHDGKPVPKVIDFGLAKATTGIRLSEHSLYTDFGTVMGTPLYMAPEQASFDAIDVDTRADVYALGVILYELLTGSTPITRETLKKKALDEMLRLIREQEAPTPSSRLSSAENCPSVAAFRKIEPRKLGRIVRGELDWIVMKALNKERDRRYETANGFAKDIERFLNHEPVSAGPPSARYRFQKFVERYRGQVIAASMVLLALLAGIAGTTWGLVEANRQAGIAQTEAMAKTKALQAETEARGKAELATLAAQAKEAEANAVVNFFQHHVFAAARPKGQDGGLGSGVTLRDAVAASEPALAKRFTQQPLVEARLRVALGATFYYLGEYDRARIQFEQARDLYSLHRGPEHPDTLHALNFLAISYFFLQQLDKSRKVNEEVLAIRKRILPKDHPAILETKHNLALAYMAMKRFDEGGKLNEEVLAIRKRDLPKDHPDILMSLHNLALCYLELKRFDEALKLNQEVLASRRKVLPENHPDTLTTMSNLALSYKNVNLIEESLELNKKVLELRKQVLPKKHPDTIHSTKTLAEAYAATGKPEQAVSLWLELPDAKQDGTALAFKHASLQAWFGQEKEYAASVEYALRSAKDFEDPITLERMAKLCLIRPNKDRAILDGAHALATKAVERGKKSAYRNYFHMVLGMAQYRRDMFADAEATFAILAEKEKLNKHIAHTVGFYRAMTLFRLGRTEEATKLAQATTADMRPLPADDKHPLADGATPPNIMIWLAYREAKALIKFQAEPPVKAPAPKKKK